MQRRIVVTGIGLVAAACCAARGQTDEAYEIKLSRPVEKGHEYRFVADSEVRMKTTVDTGRSTRQLSTVDMTVRMDSKVHVLNVDGFGRPSAVAYEIDECVMVSHGIPTVIVFPGQTLIARQQGFETNFFVKKRRFSDKERIALESVAALAAYGADDDPLYGTQEPRQIGDRWPIDTKALAADLRRTVRRHVLNENVAGTASLVGYKNLGGVPCVVVGIDFVAHGGIPREGELPPHSTVEDASLQARHYRLTPLDQALPIPADETIVDAEITFRGRIGALPATGTFVKHVRTRRQFMPLPTTASASPRGRAPGE